MQLTDAQVMTICIAIIVPVAALIHSNSRIADVRADLTKQIDALKETLRAEMKTLQIEIQSEMRAGFDRIENALRVHELEHHK